VSHPDRETLVVQAFQWGEYVGRLDLTVDGKKIVKHAGELVPVSTDIPPDATVAATLATYTAQIDAQMRQVVGRSNFEFVNARKAQGDAPIGNLIADALRDQTGAQVGLMNSGGIRAPLPKGELTRGMIFSMLPFDNKLVHFQTKGAVLQQLLDFAASRSGRSGSLQVSGVAFTVAGGKATEVMVGGKPLDPAGTYKVATIDYLAQGNDGAEVFKQVTGVVDTGLLVRDAFVNFLKTHPVLENPPGGRIKVLEAAPAGAGH
jgi:5'-nucleotidase/UDP-sugar diphosphatase